MDQLQLPQAKLLYLIAELYKTHDIDEQQKTRLKGKDRNSELNIRNGYSQ